MSKHTQGPWAWRGVPGCSNLESAREPVIFYYGFEGLVFQDNARPGLIEANARLIAESPALLALARQYASECGECAGARVCPDDSPCTECADIWLVIDRAEGRT